MWLPCELLATLGSSWVQQHPADPLSSLPWVVFLAPEMKLEDEPGLAECLGHALGSHLSKGSSALEPLQGSFRLSSHPEAQRQEVCVLVCLDPGTTFMCHIPPCNKWRSGEDIAHVGNRETESETIKGLIQHAPRGAMVL